MATPLNDALGESLNLSSWAKERMPEYLWLGLILLRYGRQDGIDKAGRILLEISKEVDTLSQPRLSKILNLSSEDQHKVFGIISGYIEKDTFAPLTLFYRRKDYPIFNKHFYISHFSIEERIKIISEAVTIYSPHQSNEATDLRFLALSLLLFSGRLKISTDAKMTIEAIQKYSYTNHEDEKMRLYRPTIRSAEGAMNIDEYDVNFSKKFWKDLGMITPCNPIKIDFEENSKDYSEFLGDCRKSLEYIFYSNKDKSLTEDKFDVIIGLANYALRGFSSVNFFL